MNSTSDIVVLFDADVRACAQMDQLVAICAEAVDADADARLVAPPRSSVEFEAGRLVFTTGGLDDVVGFRAYDTFPGSRQDQVVAVWGQSTGTLKGVVVGDQLGALRTGAIGGVAVDRLAKRDATTCAVVGAGRQARTQLAACSAVRPLTDVRVYSRAEESRRRFAEEMSRDLGVDVRPMTDVRSTVSDADIVLIATSSVEPVVDHRDLRSDAHVNTVGPKFAMAHEISAAMAEDAEWIVSDSPRQIQAHGSGHFLASSPARERIEHLGRLRPGVARSGRSLFLSTGLAGTEVLVADAILSAALVKHHAVSETC